MPLLLSSRRSPWTVLCTVQGLQGMCCTDRLGFLHLHCHCHCCSWGARQTTWQLVACWWKDQNEVHSQNAQSVFLVVGSCGWWQYRISLHCCAQRLRRELQACSSCRLGQARSCSPAAPASSCSCSPLLLFPAAPVLVVLVVVVLAVGVGCWLLSLFWLTSQKSSGEQHLELSPPRSQYSMLEQ